MAYRNKSDQAAYARKHYLRDKAAYVRRAMRHNRRTKERVRAFIAGFLQDKACLDCGEADPIVLEFDHRDRAQKLFNIGDAIREKISLRRVIAEVKKCDIRCANCHRRKTYKEQLELPRPSDKIPELPPLPLFE